MYSITDCVRVWSCVNESSCPSCWVRCLLGATMTSQTQVAALSWRLSNRSWRHTRFTDPARPPGRKGFCHLEHVRKSQHWLGKKTVGLSAAYSGRGLWQLDSWDSMRPNNTCDKFVDMVWNFRDIALSGFFEFPSFWWCREYPEAPSLNCLKMAPPRFTMAHHNTEPNPMNSWRSHWDGLGSASVKSYG